MERFKIAVIAGDGIGPEVIAEGKKVLSGIAALDGKFDVEFTDFPWGCEYYLKTGEMMPEDGLEQLKAFDAIYLGAVGYPGVPDNVSLGQLLLKIRRGFDEYVNLRPVKLLEGAPCPLAGVKREDIDMIVIRENSEGEYADVGARLYPGTPQEIALQTGVFSHKGCERIMRYAYETARREHKTLTSISKGNALGYSMVFWDEIFAEIGKEYPDVKTQKLLVDAASMMFVKNPKRFEVVVTSNLFGDILTDLGAAIAGGMAWRPVPISIRSASTRRCSSRYTAARRTSPARASQTRWRASGRSARCSTSSARKNGASASSRPSRRCSSRRRP